MNHQPGGPRALPAGIRVIFNFSRCSGPLTKGEGLEEAFRKAHDAAGVTVLGYHFVPFPDDTQNFHSDLSESHCSGGTYLDHRHVAGEVHMCHHSRNNTDKALALYEALRAVFLPEKVKVQVLDWVAE